MSGINKAIILGNLGNEPEVRFTNDQKAIATISVATSRKWKDKNTGQQQEQTEWHRVVFFNRLAEIAREYLKKGSKVYVEGSLRTNKWTDKEGVERYTTEIIANELQMLDSKNEQGKPNTPPQPTNQTGSFDSFDDDIPF